MAHDTIIQPLCLSCRIALEHKTELDDKTGLLYEIDHCPNCGEVFNRVVTE